MFAYPLPGFLVLGAVFLALTGGEALYADMGHFGKQPIRIAWFGLVLPGAAAQLLRAGRVRARRSRARSRTPSTCMVPSGASCRWWCSRPCATVIASQAVISGAFSMTRQAIQLGYIPRLEILHTSDRAIGQIYMPFVNWTLFVAVIAAGARLPDLGQPRQRLRHRGRGHDGDRVPARDGGRAPASGSGRCRDVSALVIGSMLVIDFAFLASNAAKFLSGGWFPLLIGAALFTLLMTWKRGRALMFRRLSEQGIPLKPFLEGLAAHPPQSVQGTAIFMTSRADTVPHALLHNLKHNKVLHEQDGVPHRSSRTTCPSCRVEDRVQFERLRERVLHASRRGTASRSSPTSTRSSNACRRALRARLRRRWRPRSSCRARP